VRRKSGVCYKYGGLNFPFEALYNVVDAATVRRIAHLAADCGDRGRGSHLQGELNAMLVLGAALGSKRDGVEP